MAFIHMIRIADKTGMTDLKESLKRLQQPSRSDGPVESPGAVWIEDGRIRIGSVVDAPFGLAVPFDPTRFTPLAQWQFESLGID